MNLKDFEFFHESLFDNAFDGVAYCQMIFDEGGHPVDFIYRRVSKNFEMLTGLKDAMGKKATEFVPEIAMSHQHFFEICGRVSLTEGREQFEVYIEPLLRWFLISVYSPKKNFFVAVFQNITEKKQIEKDLKNAKIAARNVLEDLQVDSKLIAHAKAKDEALLQSIGEGVVATDQDGEIILVNKIAEELLGFIESELFGRSFVKTVMLENEDGDKIADVERPINLALTSGTSTTATYNLIRKDGSKLPVMTTVAPVLLDGKPTGTVVVFRDITKEKEIEKMRTDFLALVSHQLRTPLSGTKWLIETIYRGVIGELNPKQREYIDHLYQINEMMIKMVSEILNVLTLSGGTSAIKKEDISISKLYEELFLIMEPAARNKKVILFNAFKNSDQFLIRSDPQMVRSILESFIGNAINYSSEGGRIDFDAREENNEVVFFVKDSGIGIPKEEQERIFERFYRASNAKTIRPEGTGLGLHIAFLLAQKIGAKISFESEENKGTAFYLRIPKESSNTNFS
jgi:PAS domain S-box-containing protein